MTQPSQPVTELLRSELNTVKIPPRPAVMSSIEQEMRSRAPNFGTLESIISLDVGISASLLKIANSAFFGFNGHARSVKDGLQILGLKTVASAIAALSLKKAFDHVPNLERYWDSSARIAQLSGWLVTQVESCQHRIRPEEAYTFGLFRDCGIPVLMSMYDDYYEILRAANNEETRPFTAVEDAEMGLNHTLIRWRHPERGLLAPAEFLYAIAHAGLDIPLDRWVMENALKQLAHWKVQGVQLPISINLSPRSLLDADFPAHLAATLANTPGVSGADLEIEVLESATLVNEEKATAAVKACQALGVRVALDDFGSDYSALTYFKHLPADALKIDQSYLQ